MRARPFNVALLVLDPDGAAAYARANGRIIEAAVAAANATLSQVEQIEELYARR